MKPRHQVSRAAIELIERFEGYRSQAARLADGRWTIGYGHTQTAREGATVSMEDAEALLIYDLMAVAKAINEHTYTPLTQNQFDALCAFTFNIGLENFRRSAVLRRLNEGALLQAACAMELWRKADFEGERIVVDALVRRRAAEKTLFLTPPGGFVPVPSPVLRPNLDMDSMGAVPRDAPAVVKASLDGPFAHAEREEVVPAFTPQEDLEPSLTQAAAAAVSARLATIFADTPEPAVEAEPDDIAPQPAFELAAQDPDEAEPALAPEPFEAPVAANESEPGLFDAAVETAPANDLEVAKVEPLIEPEAVESAIEPQAEPVEAEPHPLVDRPPPAAEDEFPRLVALEPEPADDEEAIETPRSKLHLIPLLGLGALGGVILAGGIFWAVVAQGGTGAGFWVGWLSGLAGIALLGRAAYLFLARLGQIGGGFEDDLNGK